MEYFNYLFLFKTIFITDRKLWIFFGRFRTCNYMTLLSGIS